MWSAVNSQTQCCVLFERYQKRSADSTQKVNTDTKNIGESYSDNFKEFSRAIVCLRATGCPNGPGRR